MSFERTHDSAGRSIIVGLIYNETLEFTSLEQSSPLDGMGNITWTFEGEPTTAAEKRWLSLYTKHRLALGIRRLDPARRR